MKGVRRGRDRGRGGVETALVMDRDSSSSYL